MRKIRDIVVRAIKKLPPELTFCLVWGIVVFVFIELHLIHELVIQVVRIFKGYPLAPLPDLTKIYLLLLAYGIINLFLYIYRKPRHTT